MKRGRDAEQPAFVIGRRSSDFLAVGVNGRSHPSARDYWDGNWVNSTVEVSVGGFRGRFGAYLRTTDFTAFQDGLAELYDSLSGEARFETTEDQLRIVVRGDGRRHFEAACIAMDKAGIGSRLEFDLEFDQTQIPEIIRDLAGITAAYPTRDEAEGSLDAR